MDVLRAANLGLRFLLELAAVVAVAYWGYEAGEGAARWFLAVAAPAVVIVLWGAFVAPKRLIDLPAPVRLGIELGVWTAAALALWAAGQEALGTGFLIAAVISGILNYIWD